MTKVSSNKSEKLSFGEKRISAVDHEFTVTFHRYSFQSFKFKVENVPDLKVQTMHRAVRNRLTDLDIYIGDEEYVFGVRERYGFRVIMADKEFWNGELHYYKPEDAAEITKQLQLLDSARNYQYMAVACTMLFIILVITKLFESQQ
ncbi:hypothetical protein CLIB1423_06S03290 [[Candida] railenensis]|uniref:Uncharacterized protein n=1 Tax=[Candida] railenensis TaxID=45579 RepID=A0A9P0VXS3_9ASCO|nr:hypothetical protein CLIB1423_06S03290 [[Candida] railenensis]